MPELKFFPETHVAYVSEIGPYRDSVQRGFKRLFEWFAQNNVRPAGASLGIFYDDPEKVAAKNLRCDLCSPVGPEVTGSGDVRTKEIGGWQVATIVYQGEENMGRAYNEVYDWLHAEGYHEADAPLEKYLSQLGEELRAEVAVPVIRQELVPATTKKGTRKTASTGKTVRKTGNGAPRTRKTSKRTTS